MLMDPQNLPERVRDVRNRIARAAARGERSVDSITLLAVSKAQPVALMRAAAALGVRDFGESYLQEALEKMPALRDVELTWHFVGRLQANKTRPIAERLAAQRPYYAPPLNLCLQVNVAGEAAKAGVAPADLPALTAAVAALPR